MQLAVIFPNEEAFYSRMGMEIVENYETAKQIFTDSFHFSNIDLMETLIYENEAHVWDKVSKQMAVVITGVSFYEIWLETYKIEPRIFFGHGIGYLTALVCTKVISLQDALEILQGKSSHNLKMQLSNASVVSASNGRIAKSQQDIINEIYWCRKNTIKPDQYITYAKELNINGILEIGPNNILTKQFHEYDAEILSGFLDVMTDQNYIMENFQQQKFFNRNYCVLRILGMIAGTKNCRLDDCREYSTEVIESYEIVKAVADEINQAKRTNADKAISNEKLMDCMSRLKRNFEYKKTPASEILERIKRLESETLMEFKPHFLSLI